MKISGFSMIHNALEGGYPIIEAIWSIYDWVDEIVITDMQSDDGTRQLLEKIGVRVIDGLWGSEAGATLANAHALNAECNGEIIIHFEADEVFDDYLIHEVFNQIEFGYHDLAVYRIQLEQNFQRCRWYPEPVHRVFPKGSVIKVGHTTDRHEQAKVVPIEHGLLYDCTNCFRDNWLGRIKNQKELWHGEQRYRRVPIHFNHSTEIKDHPMNSLEDQLEDFLNEEQWIWTTTPFELPETLRQLVGKTKYEVEEF